MNEGKTLRVLYVCPFAHKVGHWSWAAIHESHALKRCGLDVILVTFAGTRDKVSCEVPHFSVLSPNRTKFFTKFIYSHFHDIGGTVFNWLEPLLEFLSTLVLAMLLRKRLKCDIIHLRDGDSLSIFVLILSLFTKKVNWVISLVGALLRLPPGLNILSPILKLSLNKNNFIFICPDEITKKRCEHTIHFFRNFLGKIIVLPIGAKQESHIISFEDARCYLNLPIKKVVFLSFGVIHSGKDLICVLKAIKNICNVILVHAGKIKSRNLIDLLIRKYNLKDKVIIKDSYIPEEDKPYYFSAADVIILSYTKSFSQTASALWEACRFNRPVIASDNIQLKELVRKYKIGLVFHAQDPLSLENAMNNFLSLNSKEIEEMRKNTKHFCNHYSLERWAQRCLKIYRQLVISEVEES
jgi:glycosyltransferase involved in cell wall biosynthesis